MRNRTIQMAFFALISLFPVSRTVAACDFTFNYDQITASVGTVGEIGVRVQKTHNNWVFRKMADQGKVATRESLGY